MPSPVEWEIRVFMGMYWVYYPNDKIYELSIYPWKEPYPNLSEALTKCEGGFPILEESLSKLMSGYYHAGWASLLEMSERYPRTIVTYIIYEICDVNQTGSGKPELKKKCVHIFTTFNSLQKLERQLELKLHAEIRCQGSPSWLLCLLEKGKKSSRDCSSDFRDYKVISD